MEKTKISFFSSKEQKKSSIVTLEDALHEFKSGTYKESILKLRKYYKQNENDLYDALKGKLPAYCFNALFDGNRRRENITSYNPLILLDIDKIDSDGVMPLKELIAEDPYTLTVWLSPSGSGLKVLIKTNATAETHKDYFKAIQSYYETNFVPIDKSGSDITRLCYASYDKDSFTN